MDQLARWRTSAPIRDTTATFIEPIWLGRYMPQVAASQNNKSDTRSFVREIFQKRVVRRGNSTMPSEQRSRPLPASNRSVDRATPLWTARRRGTAAWCRSACRSRFAALNMVRRCFTARAPALRAASLCHACRLRIRRIGIMRNRPGLGETVAPKKWCEVKDERTTIL
jgi:hypothetical protein